MNKFFGPIINKNLDRLLAVGANAVVLKVNILINSTDQGERILV